MFIYKSIKNRLRGVTENVEPVKSEAPDIPVKSEAPDVPVKSEADRSNYDAERCDRQDVCLKSSEVIRNMCNQCGKFVQKIENF